MNYWLYLPLNLQSIQARGHIRQGMGQRSRVGGRTIDVHIRKLREKIGDEHFKTVKGVGYKFVV